MTFLDFLVLKIPCMVPWRVYALAHQVREGSSKITVWFLLHVGLYHGVQDSSFFFSQQIKILLSCITVRNINFTRQQFECILRETLYSFHALCCIASKLSLHQKVFLECVNAVPHHSKVRGVPVYNNMFFYIPVKIMVFHSLIPEVYES